jgi:4-carboxymuconolactone decarboxylase
MAEEKEPSGAQKMFGDFAPALVNFTDDVLFGQVWTRTELSQKDRSLVTVAALTTSGNTDQLGYHLGLARQNGATETELIEAITHLAFYAGWPKAMAAMIVAKQVFRETTGLYVTVHSRRLSHGGSQATADLPGTGRVVHR